MASDRRQLLDILAAGQWDGISPRPDLSTRLDAFRAYDALRLLDPEVVVPRRGWRRRIWYLIAMLKG